VYEVQAPVKISKHDKHKDRWRRMDMTITEGKGEGGERLERRRGKNRTEIPILRGSLSSSE